MSFILFDKLYKSGNNTLKYKVSIRPNINKNLKIFTKTVNTILNDKRGWGIKCVLDDTNYDFEITLVSGEDIKNDCGFGNLSCVNDIGGDKIFINNNRWSKGAKASRLNLKDYRCYLVSHEISHLLNQTHVKPIKNKRTPVLVQHTLGIGEGLPNCWPLISEKKKMRKDYYNYIKSKNLI
jgi:hypothetical protein